jgi:DNA-binding GntR family transcriptional regulator
MTPPGTFERVYAALKQRLRAGAYMPGERLEPAVLSGELNSSVTPIRDALHRLTGEGLVEAPRHEGFRAPLLTETTLRHLYAWHLDLLLLALMKRRDLALPNGDDNDDGDVPVRERQNALFRRIAESVGNPEYAATLEALTERLGPVQCIEERVLDAIEAETEEIVRAIRSGDSKALRRCLVRYHRRRNRVIPELLDSLRTGAATS